MNASDLHKAGEILIEEARARARGESAGVLEPLDFDMSTWHCGTAACAAGLFARAGLFGLELRRRYREVSRPCHRVGGKVDYEALASAFGIDFDEAHKLFNPNRPSDMQHIGETLCDFARHRSIERIQQADAQWDAAHWGQLKGED